MDENYGRLEIRLNELLKERGLSKNKLSHKAEMNWKQIDNYCTNNISRLDVFVLCKLCTVLDCSIQDLLVFYPPENLNLTLSLFNQDNSYSCIREKTFLQNAFPCYPRLL